MPIIPKQFFSFPSSRAKISWIVLLLFLIWSIRFKDISLQILQEIAILNIPLEISANCIEPGAYMMWRSLRDGIFSLTVLLLYKLSSKRKKCQTDVCVIINEDYLKNEFLFHFGCRPYIYILPTYWIQIKSNVSSAGQRVKRFTLGQSVRSLLRNVQISQFNIRAV